MDRLAAELLRVADEISGSVLNKAGQKRFARLQKLVDKFNALREEAIELTGGDDDIYYDTSSTIDSGPSYIGEASLFVRGDRVVLSYETEDVVGWSLKKKRSMMETMEPIDASGYFNDYTIKDELKYMIRCVNKAITWFRKYNPDMTDEQAEKLLEDQE